MCIILYEYRWNYQFLMPAILKLSFLVWKLVCIQYCLNIFFSDELNICLKQSKYVLFKILKLTRHSAKWLASLICFIISRENSKKKIYRPMYISGPDSNRSWLVLKNSIKWIIWSIGKKLGRCELIFNIFVTIHHIGKILLSICNNNNNPEMRKSCFSSLEKLT